MDPENLFYILLPEPQELEDPFAALRVRAALILAVPDNGPDEEQLRDWLAWEEWGRRFRLRTCELEGG